jgi:hypothetical protein
MHLVALDLVKFVLLAERRLLFGRANDPAFPTIWVDAGCMLLSIGAVLPSARRMEALQCDFAIFVRCPNRFSGCTNSKLLEGKGTRTLEKGKKRKKDWAPGRSNTGD